MSPTFSAINRAMNTTVERTEKLNAVTSRAQEMYYSAEKGTLRWQDAMSAAAKELGHTATETESLESAVSDMNSELGKVPPATQKAGEGFTVMKGVAVQAITAIARAGKEMLNDFIGFGDNMINISARLNMIAGEAETVAGLQDEIFFAAQRSRGSYDAMADSVAKLGAQARDAFGSNQEIIAFSELLNKTFVTAGTNASGMESVMYNLTQAMGSGVLRGQDLNAVMSNTPQILQYVADYMGVPIGQIRAMAEEGVLSASIIKEAMFAGAADINEKFESMPRTFEQTTTMMSNSFKHAFDDMGIAFSQFMSEKIESGMNWIIDNFDTIANVAAITGAVLIGAGVGVAAAWMLANLPIVAIIGGVILLGSVLADFGIGADQVLGFVGGTFGWLYGTIQNTIGGAWNYIASFVEFFANVWHDPIGSVQRLFISLFDNILHQVEAVAGAIGSLLGQDWGSAISGFRDRLNTFAESTYGADATRIGRMELLNPYDAMSAGAGFASGAGRALLDGVNSLKDTMANGYGDFDLSEYTTGSGGKSFNTAGEVKIDSEDIKMLLDISTMRFQANYQTLAPQVSVGDVTINDGADFDSFMGQLADTVEGARSSSLSFA